MKGSTALGIAAGVAVVAGLLVAARRGRTSSAPGAQSARKKKTMGDTLVEVILSYLPNPDSVLGPGDPNFDMLLGGKIAEGKWRRFEKGHGTTCGVAAVGFGEQAGLPPDLLNSAPPKGSGFTPGAHFSRFRAGAQKRGWLQTPTTGELPDLRAGDIYVSEKPPKNGVDGAHIGAIVSAVRKGDTIEIETADGGQDEGLKIRRRRRTVKMSDGGLTYYDGSAIPRGVVAIITPGVGNTRLEWWIRLGEEQLA